MTETTHGQHAADRQSGSSSRSFGLAPVGPARARHAAGPQDGRLPVLGIDIGGTKIAAGVVTPGGEVLSSAKVVTAGRADAEQLWSAVVEAGELALVRAGVERVAGVGCGSAGPMAWPEGVVSPLNLPQWREFPLAARLRERWPNGPVRVHNDAVCVAIAEHWTGSAAGHANALGMVVSTGIGGGLILNGRVDNGGLGNAGHIGHMVADPQGPRCVCGGVGCLEAIARGPAIVSWAQQQGWQPAAGQDADGVGLLLSAREGDPTAVAAFRRSGEAVGAVLASVAALLDLDIAAVGGGIINAGGLLFGPMQEAFDRHAGLGFVRRLRIVPATAGQDAGIIGAAGLVAAGDCYWTPPE